MSETFVITLSQMMVLFFFMALGYIFQKKKLCPENSSTVLSKLEVYILLPSLSFSTFAERFEREVLGEKLKTILWSTFILVISGVAAYFIARLFSKKRETVSVFTYAFTIPNMSYIGYPLMSAVFGEDALFDFMVFVLPFQVYIYTVAIYMLNPKHELKLKSVLNPALVALFLGAIWGIFDLPLPNIAKNILDLASGCMAPLAMLLTGFVLARRPLLQLIKSPKMYLASILRLIVFPIVFSGILFILGADNKTVMLCACLLSLPMGLNNIVFPEAFGGDSDTGAQSCFVCNILGLFTVPVMYTLISTLLV